MLAQYEQLLNAVPEITCHEQPPARDHPAAPRRRSSGSADILRFLHEGEITLFCLSRLKKLSYFTKFLIAPPANRAIVSDMAKHDP